MTRTTNRHLALGISALALFFATPATAATQETAGGTAYSPLALPLAASFPKPRPQGHLPHFPRHHFKARLRRSGTATVPNAAPWQVQRAIRAGNRIAKLPYIWGGGHGAWEAGGYDCSGSVSYALHAGKLLGTPATSGTLESYGEPGEGKWITLYANGGHVFAKIAGLYFDTSGASPSRWQRGPKPTAAYVVRHPDGL